jgi:SAM-dependent methyltransferase
MITGETIRQEVRRRYGAAARRAQQRSGCCGPGEDAITSNLYGGEDIATAPQEALLASLGCGNPVAVAGLRPGETVLDLGSGGGIDVLLSAKRVGPTGKAYGLDMTEEMLDLARENQKKAGVTNATFLKGEMENIPLPGDEVDVIISNCVVNLSPDKDAVFREAYRVLKPGGRIAIADIVTRGSMPAALKSSLELWTGCIAGALSETEYREKVAAAGFEGVEIEPFREYTALDAESGGLGRLMKDIGKAGADGLGIFSAIVRAVKPAPAQRSQANEETLTIVASSKDLSCGPGSCC